MIFPRDFSDIGEKYIVEFLVTLVGKTAFLVSVL